MLQKLSEAGSEPPAQHAVNVEPDDRKQVSSASDGSAGECELTVHTTQTRKIAMKCDRKMTVTQSMNTLSRCIERGAEGDGMDAELGGEATASDSKDTWLSKGE